MQTSYTRQSRVGNILLPDVLVTTDLRRDDYAYFYL